MPEYGNMNQAFAGLRYGIMDGDVETRIAQEEVGFGLPVFGYEGEIETGYKYYADVAKVVFDADFVASNSIIITVNGTPSTATVFDTDQETTLAALVANVAALAGVECVADDSDVDGRTILVRTKGATAVVTEAITGGASQATGTITTGSGQVFLGITMSTQKEDFFYNALDTMNVVHKTGRVYAQVTGVAVANGKAYLGTDGKFSATAGTDIGCVFVSNEVADAASGNNIAIVEVADIAALTYASSF